MDALQNNRIRHTLGALAGALSVVCSGGPQSALNASGASGSSASVRAMGVDVSTISGIQNNWTSTLGSGSSTSWSAWPGPRAVGVGDSDDSITLSYTPLRPGASTLPDNVRAACECGELLHLRRGLRRNDPQIFRNTGRKRGSVCRPISDWPLSRVSHVSGNHPWPKAKGATGARLIDPSLFA
jgi:hypothetical protein